MMHLNGHWKIDEFAQPVRIIGAGYWRKGRKTYEKENPIES